MSEYQYYEFLALDRPLATTEMRELRALSTRAVITATRFTNHYEWGDFKGNPDDLIERLFDAHVYFANWGTHRLLFCLPAHLFHHATARPYQTPETLRLRATKPSVIVEFLAEEVEDDEMDDEMDDGRGWMGALAPLRAELLRGDWRALYLGWLRAAEQDELDEDTPEPPLPAGLGELSAPLTALAEFLDLDPDWLAAAADASPKLVDQRPRRAEIAAWLEALPAAEKDSALLDLLDGDVPHLQAELLQRFARSRPGTGPPAGPAPRTVGQLGLRAQKLRLDRERREAQQREEEFQARERQLAEEREQRVRQLAGREEQAWREAATLLEATRAAEYDQAVQLLGDLRLLASRSGHDMAFLSRLDELRLRYSRKRSFWERLRDAGVDRP